MGFAPERKRIVNKPKENGNVRRTPLIGKNRSRT